MQHSFAVLGSRLHVGSNSHCTMLGCAASVCVAGRLLVQQGTLLFNLRIYASFCVGQFARGASRLVGAGVHADIEFVSAWCCILPWLPDSKSKSYWPAAATWVARENCIPTALNAGQLAYNAPEAMLCVHLVLLCRCCLHTELALRCCAHALAQRFCIVSPNW
jgi:hypothetical protein